MNNSTPVSKTIVLEASHNKQASIAEAMRLARCRVIDHIMSPKLRNLWLGTSRTTAEALADAHLTSESGDITVFDYRVWKHLKSGQQRAIEIITLRAKSTNEDVVYLSDEELKLISE
jgi:hypothetical protein